MDKERKKTHPPQKVNKPAGANTRNLNLALAAWSLPRVDTKNPAAIEERMEMYLRHCAENDVAPSVSGCCAWLGVYRDLLQDYYQGKLGTPEHQIVAAKFYNVIQNVWAMDMHDGNINPVSGIFIGKTFFGFKDTQDIIISTNNASQERLTNAELIAEAARLPGANTLALPEGTQTVEEAVVDEERYLKAVERKKRIDERKAKQTLFAPNKKEYLKQYYRAHTEDYKERRRRNDAKRKAQKEAQKVQEAQDKQGDEQS